MIVFNIREESEGSIKKWKKGRVGWRKAWQPTPVFLPGESHREAWQAMVYSVTKSWTRLRLLSTHTHI